MANKPKVLLMSDVTSGGAAISCRRLLAGLQAGSRVDAAWVAADGDRTGGAAVAGRWPDLRWLLLYRLTRRLAPRSAGALQVAQRMHEQGMRLALRRIRPDLLNLHNIHERMSFSFVARLAAHLPVVWTLHDMWPLTGGCCYSFECREYLRGCKTACPLPKDAGQGAQAAAWASRERFFLANRERMTFVCPSAWLADVARERFGQSMRVEHIPYALSTDTFRPLGDRPAVRRLLGLPLDRSIVLVGSPSLNDERKGARFVVEAGYRLASRLPAPPLVVAFGMAPEPESVPADWLYVGQISDEFRLNMLYNAADVFVLPSLSDNLPNTLLEAMASGTPCVTFDVGGCPEVVRHGHTGFVARRKDAGDLTSCLERTLVMEDKEAEAMRRRCRETAEKEYALSVQARRYAALFDEMLAADG